MEGQKIKLDSTNIFRILIVVHYRVVQVGLQMLLKDSNIDHSLNFASTFSEVLRVLSQDTYDLVILDFNVPGANSIKMIELLKVKYPSIRILVFSSLDEHIYARQCLRCGAQGFINISATDEEFKKAISRILNGQIYVSDQLQQELLNEYNGVKKPATEHPLRLLSPREAEVMKLLTQGLSTTEISNNLNLQPSTVSTYKNRIFKKLAVRNVVELIEAVEFLKGEN